MSEQKQVVFASRFANHGFHIKAGGKEVRVSFAKSFYKTDDKDVIAEIRRLISDGKLKDVTEVRGSSYQVGGEETTDVLITINGTTYKSNASNVVRGVKQLLSENRFEKLENVKEPVLLEKNPVESDTPPEEHETADESGKPKKKGK